RRGTRSRGLLGSSASVHISVAAAGQLWVNLDRLIARAASEGLRAHGLELYAAGNGRSPASDDQERVAIVTALAAPYVLERVRAACTGPILLMKGPEAAACYLQPHVREFHDLDLLVPDAEAAQRELVEAGFE